MGVGKQILYCGDCGKVLKEEDFERLKAGYLQNSPYCIQCCPNVVLSTPPAPKLADWDRARPPGSWPAGWRRARWTPSSSWSRSVSAAYTRRTSTLPSATRVSYRG